MGRDMEKKEGLDNKLGGSNGVWGKIEPISQTSDSRRLAEVIDYSTDYPDYSGDHSP